MRNLIVSNAMSLDGYYTGYTGPDDNVIVLELDPAFDAYNATPQLISLTESYAQKLRQTG